MAYASIFSIAVVVVCVLCAHLAQVLYRRLCVSPLRHIPGPFWAKTTSKWLTIIDLLGHRTATIHQLHEQYGPVVRVGPHEVSFSNIESIKDIYGAQTAFIKAPIYEAFSTPPYGIFSQRNKTLHAQRRRLLSHVFAQSNLYDTEPMIQKHVLKLLKILRAADREPIDVLYFFRVTAFDIVGDLFLGQSFGGLDSRTPPQFLQDMDSLIAAGVFDATFPWVYFTISRLPFARLRHFIAGRDRFGQAGRDALNLYLSEHGRFSTRKDLLAKIISAKVETGQPPLTDQEVSQEASNLIFGGTDTTSTTLTYLFWELSKNPAWQNKLLDELSQSSLDASMPILPYQKLQNLPILDAVTLEALRLHPAAPSSLPREVPSGGRLMQGYLIPERTVVSMQCYTTQRDPNAFSQPDEFRPERWLEPELVSAEMKELFMPFSKGSRACLGKNLAMMELKVIAAAVIRSFSVDVASGTTDDTMTMTDHFLLLPKARKCDLVFQARRKV